MTLLKKILPFGEIMVSLGIITKEQLETALKEGKRTNTRVGKVLVNLGFAKESEIANALAVQYQIPAVMLSSTVLDPSVVKLIPESIARRYLVIPIALDGDTLQVAMIDPLNVFAINEINRATRYKIKTIVTTETEITNAIEQYYHAGPYVPTVAANEEAPEAERPSDENLEKIAGDSSVIELVDQLISTAVTEGASDIHVEPDKDTLRVRMRVAGALRDALELPRTLHPAIIARIKLIGGLDMSQKNSPQSGRCSFAVFEKTIDMRLAVMPTVYGERAVMKVIERSGEPFKLEELALLEDGANLLKKAVEAPRGLCLLAAPPGCGKSATAVALIESLSSEKKNIFTVEDPVEYDLKRINQTSIDRAAGLSAGPAFRHVLRQDPDVVMLGEIDCKDTAETVMQASINGLIVVAGIRTSGAIGAISNLMHMGIEPYLISSSINCVVGQRLVRKVCANCKHPDDSDAGALKELGVKAPALKSAKLLKGAGCPECKGTGLCGRAALFEILFLDDEIRSLINNRAVAGVILDAAVKNGFQTLRAEGIRAVLGGLTTLDEVLRAT